MKLSRSEINVLFKALQDGYRNSDDLKIMVRLKLGENLAEIVQPDQKIDIVILELIEWAESKDKLLDLVWGANERNPDNDQIKKVSYRLFGITQAQWEKLCELLAEINPTDLEFACKESFKPKKILEVDSRLVDLKSLDWEEIQDILKENLIKKREESLRKVPVVLEFADCLSGMLNVGMNTICSDLKRWTEEVNNQLSKLGKKNGSYRKMNTNLDDLDLDDLKNLLKQEKWIEADIETRKLLIDSIGNPKFVNEENFQNIKCDLLRGIDKLWREESKGRFGFSVQKEIWENINNRYSSFKKQRLIINRFGAEVGWYDNDIDEWLDVPKTNQDIECKTEGFWPTPPPSIISVDTIGKDLIPCLMKKLESCDFP